MSTWNPSDKGGDVTLSASDLTATITTNSRMAVRSTTSKSSGKWYFEVLVGSDQIGIGVANSSAPVSNAGNSFWESAHGIALYMNGANSVIVYNGSTTQTLAGFANGDVIGVAIDIGAGTIQFYKNNSAHGTADANMGSISGALFAAVGGHNSAASQIGSGRFSSASQTYSAPTNFSAWDSSVTHAMTGGVSIGGEATVFPPPAHPITGGVKIGSDFTIFVKGTFIHEMTGGVSVGGLPVIAISHPEASTPYAPIGGVVWGGGAARISDIIPYFPVPAGVIWDGSAVIQERINVQPTGGVVWAGAVSPITAYFSPVSGGVVWSGGTAPITKYAISSSGGVVWSGEAAVAFRESIFFPSGGVVFGGTALAYMVDTDTVITPENPLADPFPGWMVNVENGAASRYLGLPANSITQFGGKTYVTNAAGVYEIIGDDDASAPIKSSVEFPTTDFQDSREKRMEVAYVGIKTTGRMKLKLMVNGYAPLYFFLMPSSDKHKGTRIPIGKGMVGRYWGTRIDNVKGCDFSIESAEFKPVVGQRHGA